MKRNVVLLVGLLLSIAVPAEAADDFSSPKATMKTLLGILKQGEVDRVSECFAKPRSDDERVMLLYGLSDDVYIPAMHQALTEKFGEDASPLGRALAGFDQQIKVIDAMEETTDTMHGRLFVKGLEARAMDFVNERGNWKIAIKAGSVLRSVPPERLASATALRAAYLDTIQEIKEGKFANAEEAIKAVEARRAAARAAK